MYVYVCMYRERSGKGRLAWCWRCCLVVFSQYGQALEVRSDGAGD